MNNKIELCFNSTFILDRLVKVMDSNNRKFSSLNQRNVNHTNALTDPTNPLSKQEIAVLGESP
jgi:hypothetical protein